jgi:hypothetical protein
VLLGVGNSANFGISFRQGVSGSIQWFLDPEHHRDPGRVELSKLQIFQTIDSDADRLGDTRSRALQLGPSLLVGQLCATHWTTEPLFAPRRWILF